jgi:hypothetical protein
MVYLNEIIDDLHAIAKENGGVFGDFKVSEISFVEKEELVCLVNNCEVPVRVYPDGTLQMHAHDFKSDRTKALAQKVQQRYEEKLALETGAEIKC